MLGFISKTLSTNVAPLTADWVVQTHVQEELHACLIAMSAQFSDIPSVIQKSISKAAVEQDTIFQIFIMSRDKQGVDSD